jgi:type IV secretion system protein VirB11
MTGHLFPATAERRNAMLRTAFGPAIAAALADETVIEVMANPDGRLWVDRHGSGRSDTGQTVTPQEAERIIRLVASHIGAECHGSAPIVSAELPDTGERFEGVVPPVAASPCFSIRKPARILYTLDDYVSAGIMTGSQAETLSESVRSKANIVIAGGTSSGKTTLTNALLAEVAKTGDRVLILEDTRELVCAAKDCVQLRTKDGVAALKDLVRSTMRLRPDRIVVGEVRGGEALDLLKSWNTGHPGGIATVHANGAEGALTRLEQLAQEIVVTVPRSLIADAVDLVVFIARREPPIGRRVEAIVRVDGQSADGHFALTPLCPIPLTIVQPGSRP